jgi:hypothetical protein
VNLWWSPPDGITQPILDSSSSGSGPVAAPTTSFDAAGTPQQLLQDQQCSGGAEVNLNTTTFIGNAILVGGLLCLLFLLHLLVVSCVEARWLAKDRARHQVSSIFAVVRFF